MSEPEKRTEKDWTPEELVDLAKGNHIWLNAFSCIRPTPEFLQSVGAAVVAKAMRAEVLDDWIASPSVTYIRINKS